MAAEIHDHIHLHTATPPTAQVYPVTHGSWDYTPGYAMYTERSLTGKLQVHRLMDTGLGVPVTFNSDQVRLKLTLAEMLVIRELAGKHVYYVPNYHEDIGGVPQAAYIYTSVFALKQGAIVNIDPSAGFWYVTLSIVDNEIT